jgi:hypothetical protein
MDYDPTCKIGMEMEANELVVEIDLENTIRVSPKLNNVSLMILSIVYVSLAEKKSMALPAAAII